VSNSVVATVVSEAEEQATSALMQNAKSATIKARYFIANLNIQHRIILRKSPTSSKI
jgi:hypothetical protein